VGACEIEPIPFLTTINELRTIEVDANRVLFRFDNSGDDAVREVQRVVQVDDVPTLGPGKPDRAALRARAALL
jgi:hypothetical protein